MARVDIIMPQMGESIAEGTLSKWLKKVGDEVKRDSDLWRSRGKGRRGDPGRRRVTCRNPVKKASGGHPDVGARLEQRKGPRFPPRLPACTGR